VTPDEAAARVQVRAITLAPTSLVTGKESSATINFSSERRPFAISLSTGSFSPARSGAGHRRVEQYLLVEVRRP
jgi:hypothetical protein